jgi:hypothetical protein
MSQGITLTNVKHVAQSFLTSLDGWIREMTEYRMDQCPECVAAGKCVKQLPGEEKPKGCGCSVPALMKVPHRKDSRGRWDQVLNEEAWKVFKAEDPRWKKYLEEKNAKS